MADKQVYVAITSFSVDIDGVPTAVSEGVTRVEEGHELMAGDRAQYWKPVDAMYSVERATAAPGEKREAPAPAEKPAAAEKKTTTRKAG